MKVIGCDGDSNYALKVHRLRKALASCFRRRSLTYLGAIDRQRILGFGGLSGLECW